MAGVALVSFSARSTASMATFSKEIMFSWRFGRGDFVSMVELMIAARRVRHATVTARTRALIHMGGQARLAKRAATAVDVF